MVQDVTPATPAYSTGANMQQTSKRVTKSPALTAHAAKRGRTDAEARAKCTVSRDDISHTVRVGVEVCKYNGDGSLRDSADVGVTLQADGGFRDYDFDSYGLDLNIGIDEGALIEWQAISLRKVLALRDCLNAAIAEAARIGAIPANITAVELRMQGVEEAA